MTDDLEARLRAAIHAEAEHVDAELPPERPAAPLAAVGPVAAGEDESLTAIRSKVRTIRRRRRAVALAAATALVVVGLAALPRLAGDPTDVNTIGPANGDLTPVPPDVSTTAPPATTAPATPGTTEAGAVPPAGDPEATTTTTAPPDPYTLGRGFQPLWPFADREAATAWQAAYRTGGSQPWHLDAEATALSFTTGFLGFTEIDQVVDSQISGDDAHVSVGYANPDGGGTATAAVVHLMRYGTGDDAPWEVVGTRDTDLQLETPDYATTARSPMTVGGYITGVDESLRVQVRQSSTAAPLGESAPFPGGGTHAPWQTTVTFSGATDPALTVVVSTGGHVQDVERFAITGLARLGR
jgi:hypothetical protein